MFFSFVYIILQVRMVRYSHIWLLLSERRKCKCVYQLDALEAIPSRKKLKQTIFYEFRHTESSTKIQVSCVYNDYMHTKQHVTTEYIIFFLFNSCFYHHIYIYINNEDKETSFNPSDCLFVRPCTDSLVKTWGRARSQIGYIWLFW